MAQWNMKLSPKRTDLTGSGSSIHSTAHSGNSPKSEPLNTLDAAMIRRWSRYGAGVHCYILSCCRVRQGCRSGLPQYLRVVVTKGIERRYALGSEIPLKMVLCPLVPGPRFTVWRVYSSTTNATPSMTTRAPGLARQRMGWPRVPHPAANLTAPACFLAAPKPTPSRCGVMGAKSPLSITGLRVTKGSLLLCAAQ